MAQQNSGKNPVEIYRSRVDKASKMFKKFSRIMDMPIYQRYRFDTYFFKVIKVYTELWKFQQENCHELEAGFKKWEIGEIASQIGQLYFGQYMSTSEASCLSESCVFYETLLTTEYFKEGLFEDHYTAKQQLRFLARFITICLLFNHREMVNQLVSHLRLLLDNCKRVFQEVNFREWQLAVQEIDTFLEADTAFMNIRPLRYSLALDPHPDTISHVSLNNPKRNKRLRNVVLSSYHPNEVKYAELTLDTYRMVQSLEWEPAGVLYKPRSVTGLKQLHDLTDPTLPQNPQKAVLYRPSITYFIAVLATACDNLPSDGVLLIYLSGKGSCLCFDVTSMPDGQSPSSGNVAEVSSTNHSDFIHIGSPENKDFIYPSDLLPFARRPLFIVIDSDSSMAFKTLSGAEKVERVAMLLSPKSFPPMPNDYSSWQAKGSLFTIFLTAPFQAFCLLLGFSGSHVQMDMYENFNQLMASALSDWGLILATSRNLDPAWSQILCDPFLTRLLLRFIFCEAVLTLYTRTHNNLNFIPQCHPSLPESVHPTAPAIQSTIMKIAKVFDATTSFIFSEDLGHFS